MKMKQIIGIVITAALLLCMLAACAGDDAPPANTPQSDGNGNNGSSDNSGSSGATQDEPVNLRVVFLSWAPQPPDLGKVQDALNEILIERINATVELVPINGAEYQQRINLMLQNGEKLDLFATGVGLGYPVQASLGMLRPLDDLLASEGSGILDTLGHYIDAARVAGTIYGVPTLQSYSAATTFVMRQDLIDKHNIDVDAIKTLDDLGGVFQVIADNEPDIIPLIPESPGAGVFGLGIDVLYDPLGDTIGVLANYGQNTTVVNLFETPEYETWVNRLHDWYNKGYIMLDAATTTETAAALIAMGRGFGHFTGVAVGAADNATAAYGVPMAAVTFGDSFISAGNITTVVWSIAAQSEHPEAAMRFLNLLYTDKEVVNLIDYGIEGEHYIMLGENIIGYPEGLDPMNHPYALNLAWQFGNVFLSYIPLGMDPEIWDKAAQANDSALLSHAFGFTPDMSSVTAEFTNVLSVIGQYMVALNTGAVDPDVYLPEFIDKLKSAGIDTIVAEKQSQLDAWLAEQSNS